VAVRTRVETLEARRAGRVNAVPLYLVVVPTTTFLVQLLFAGPAMEFGRNRAIAKSAELIDSLERYHGARGRYPRSLSGLWPDYKTSVVGIEQFHYAATDSAYSLFFELPVLLVHPVRKRS